MPNPIPVSKSITCKTCLTSVCEDASVEVNLVNSTLYDTLRMHACDNHLVTTGSGLVIKFRIDGVLNNISKI